MSGHEHGQCEESDDPDGVMQYGPLTVLIEDSPLTRALGWYVLPGPRGLVENGEHPHWWEGT